MQQKRAAVIGAGYSGLACAALLARDGWRVTVIEKNREIGGRARSWREQGFTFDMGPSWYLMPEVFERFFSLFDVRMEDYYRLLKLDPYYQVFFSPDEKVLISSDQNKNSAVFNNLENGGAAKLQDYLRAAAYKYDIAMREFLYRDYKKLTDFFNRRLIFEGLKLNVFRKLDSFVGSYFKDRRLRQLLEYAMVFLGTSPEDAPALYSIMSHVDLGLGVYFPEGGMAGAAQGIARLAQEQGVEFRLEEEAQSIQVVNNRASAVITDKDEIGADIVVGAADYHHIESRLLAPEHRNYSEKYWQKRVVAPSMFIAYLGIGRKLPGLEHHNLYFAEDWNQHFRSIFKTGGWPRQPCFYLSCISRTDNSTAPTEGENVFLLVPVAPDMDDNEEQRETYFEHICDHIQNITGEDLRRDLIVKRLYAHSDFCQDYNAFKGTALGLAHTLRQTAVFRPARCNRKVENLYYTGQYTHPGIGVPMVLIAAEVTAGEIRDTEGHSR